MIKKLVMTVVSATIMTTNIHAMDKEMSYKIINQCKFNLNEKTGKSDSITFGLLLGMGVAYSKVLRDKGIDNDYASLDPSEFSDKMCAIALKNRDDENKKTGGKYDVTQFYDFLTTVGLIMTLPPKQNTNETN